MLCKRLALHGIDVWLDEENLKPGQDWQFEVKKAVRNSDVILVCLSRASVNREGFIQKEITFALDVADEKPEGTIFLIPAKLEECDVPERLRRWHWVSLFEESGIERLLSSLLVRMRDIEIQDPNVSNTIPDENRGPIETKAKLPPKILQAAGILEPHRTEHSFKSVGGLDALKRWLTLRRAAFFYKGPERVPPPRGILLFGPPGCGKSLIVTATANEWAVPLFRLDFGKIFGSYVGQSEENMRAAFSLAQSSAPCILWVDEVDLRLAAAGRDRPVDPIVIRMINMLLLWFAEATQVFTIATANDLDRIPPELLRPGTFDQLFFVDLPTSEERAAILAVALTNAGQDSTRLDLNRHAAASHGFSGSQIHEAVVSALYETLFGASERTVLQDRHLEAAFSSVKPMLEIMGPSLDRLRERRQNSGWQRA